MNMILTVTQNTRTLEIDTFYAGALGLNQLVVIDNVKIYYDDVNVMDKLSNPIEISGSGKIVIPINEQIK